MHESLKKLDYIKKVKHFTLKYKDIVLRSVSWMVF